MMNGYVLINTSTGRMHTGYFSYVAPKIYIRSGDAKGARTRMYDKDEWQIWRIENLVPVQKIDPNPVRKQYRYVY